MKKTAIILIFLILLSGCSITGGSVVCNEPYIQVGTECCLDEDNNNICDKDETTIETKQETTTSSIQTKEVKTSSTYQYKNYLDESSAKAVIKKECEDTWSSDFSMRVYCENKQYDAWKDLQELNAPLGMSLSDANGIKKECEDTWGSDFSMRVYCENKQYDAWKKLYS